MSVEYSVWYEPFLKKDHAFVSKMDLNHTVNAICKFKNIYTWLVVPEKWRESEQGKTGR